MDKIIEDINFEEVYKSSMRLQEMAVVGKSCGWFRMLVKSNESASKTEKAHVSIQETNKWTIIGKVFLTSENAPSKDDTLQMEPPNLLKGKDIDAFKEWANAPYRNTNITNWQQAKNFWEDQLEAFHPSQI